MHSRGKLRQRRAKVILNPSYYNSSLCVRAQDNMTKWKHQKGQGLSQVRHERKLHLDTCWHATTCQQALILVIKGEQKRLITTDCVLYFVHTWWSSPAASVCIYNMAVCSLSAQSGSFQSAQFIISAAWEKILLLPHRSALIRFCICLFSLCRKLKALVCHRPTNVLFPRPASSAEPFIFS